MSLFTRSAREHVLLLAVHHIVIDFWSLALILNELSVLYPAQKAGVPAVLPPLDLQYTDYRSLADRNAGGPARRTAVGLLAQAIGRTIARAESSHRSAAAADSDLSRRLARLQFER